VLFYFPVFVVPVQLPLQLREQTRKKEENRTTREKLIFKKYIARQLGASLC
jgi:hypothetical protein